MPKRKSKFTEELQQKYPFFTISESSFSETDFIQTP